MHTQSKSFDIVILTDSRYVDPKETNWYIDQILLEDKLLLEELEKKNLRVCKKIGQIENLTGIQQNM